MNAPPDGFEPFRDRMLADGLPAVAVETFERQYRKLASGETGLLAEADLEPVASLPDAGALPAELAGKGREAMPRTVLIKLNGGLGTSMGLAGAKSLLKVRGELSFLDIILRQVRSTGSPLVLMNSFRTRAECAAILERQPPPGSDLPRDFLQHRVPKVRASDLSPAVWPADPELEWCPPGHGDLYAALVSRGLLETFLDRGLRWAFVSNADNLGAMIDPVLLGYMVASRLTFMMEVADRTPADRKGGHLARRPDGRFVLRELAQCPEPDRETFQDIERHRYFNTNNLWIDLGALRETLRAVRGVLELPLIRNRKTLDPRDPGSPAVYQLETAMGAAIEVFEGAGAVRVPRSRFAPVKTTDDLVAVRSDAYVLTGDHRVVLHPGRGGRIPEIRLDPVHYRMVDQVDRCFPGGVPSMLRCERLVVRGDIVFGRDTVLEGDVTLINESGTPVILEDGLVLEGLRRF